MELSYSQTPSRVWWALEASASLHLLDDLRSAPASPVHPSASSPSPERTPGAGNFVFYDYVDETDHQDSEEELRDWLKQHRNRGIIRVYQPGSSYCEVMKCDVETTAGTVMARCLAKELYVHYGSKKVRKIRFDEHPLQLQHHFLQELGHSNIYHMQLEGLQENLSTLIKFVAGEEVGERAEDKVQLSCALKVKEVNGSLIPFWNKRFCVICGSRMFIFSSVKPKGKPTVVVDFKGATVEEYKSKKHAFCLKITAGRHVVCLAFDTRTQQSKWLERAEQILSKHPLEANLSGYSLERVPKYYFLNYNIKSINLAHNFMIESFSHTDAAILGQSRTIGWLEDLPIFHQLVSLSLSDNGLEQFPISLCNLSNLKELDISCNSIKTLPVEIRHLTKLTILLLHANQLSDLPYEVSELSHLLTLVIAFNRFFDLPKAAMKLPSLKILIASGNYISDIPEEIIHMGTLQHLDVRFNKIKGNLPMTILSLRNLLRLNLRGNKVSEINTTRLPLLEILNCSEASLRTLSLPEGPLKTLIAKNNKITHFSVPRSCEHLTSIDLSKNELTSLPESLALLENLQKLNASDNMLTQLPSKIFKMNKLEYLKVYRNRLVTLPNNFSSSCFIKVLDIHSNQISSLPENLLTSCIKCEVLNLSSNRLQSLPPSPDSSELKELYAASNRLKDGYLAVISRYKKLKVLHLAYNKLRNISSGFFSNFLKLEYLNLAGNSLSSLPSILNSPYLRCLILHSNNLNVLPAFPILRRLHTLDLSCNQFEKIPTLKSFPRLNFLDVSGSSSLVIDEDSTSVIRSSDVSHCCLEGILDLREMPSSSTCMVESGGTTTHGRWSFGSATVTGIQCDKNCTAQVKLANLSTLTNGGLFAVMDGGRSPKVPQALREMLKETILEELAMDDASEEESISDADPLRYLSHTFLTLHRKLGELGQKDGSSLILCHIQEIHDHTYRLNVANSGLGEAILCRSGRVVPLTTQHSPSGNSREMMRIADARGFVSQDDRVNGVCGSSRLLGVYHLWPQVIPLPSTESVDLRKEDEYIIIGTSGLWKYISYEQIVQEATSISDPTLVAKRLRDIAVAHGCNEDVSIVVVKLNIDRDPEVNHRKNSTKKQVVPTREEEADEEDEEENDDDEELGITNIDDTLSDIEEESRKSTAPGIALKMDSLTPREEVMDRMVLSAITTTNGHTLDRQLDEELMQSTNFDELQLSDDDSPGTPSLPVMGSTPSRVETIARESQPAPPRQSRPPLIDQQQLAALTPAEYEAQTLPKITPSSRKSTGLADFDTSFEQTQSVPILQAKQVQTIVTEPADAVDHQLLALNKALIQLSIEESVPPNGRPSTYHMESIERPRKKNGLKNGRNRLSYVEHSYNQLTNEVYTANSIPLMHHAKELQTS